MQKPEDVETKPYHQMTPAERLAHRIAKNREIDQRVINTPVKASGKKAATEISTRSSAVRGVLDQFQQIKKNQGIDAASDFVLSRVKK